MLQCEQVLSFSDLARALPSIGGRRVNQSTVWRWALKGCRGIRLECQRLGGRYFSSIEACERFSRACAEASVAHLAERQSQREQSAKALSTSAEELAPLPSSALRRKQIARANRELDAAGIV